ncbi:MAG TPA: Stk1 family PASTA domain-containing Ser/Thr kinase [Bacilli bacterium]|nr:Stk1 family PASTA domain-containing Ser/Thr kinase [Bacilli bacterium]
MIVKGQKINDRYEILKNIGEGGMANVYLAQDAILDRLVAIKVLRGDLANDEKFVRRFQREALAASSLSHPNIVEMYDVGEDDGNYYIVMEFVEGKTLKQLIKKRDHLTIEEVVDIMLQITDAMATAHDALIIHRDLKPQNIMIKEDGGIKITDFGIAMALNSTQLTQTNSVMGSVHYLPPEQASGKGATLKSDIYSLGIMMYELVTGRLPFKGENAVEIALKHLKDELPSVKEIDPNVPQSIDNIIRKAAAKNPKNRYNNAREMYEDLNTCLNKERLNEPKRELKHDNLDASDTKILELAGDVENSIVKQVMEDDKKEGKNLGWLFIILGVLFLGVIGAFFIYPALTKTTETKIPDVKGLTIEAAESMLEKQGLIVALDVLKIEDEELADGLVVKTSPTIGRTVKKGTEITLYVSTGVIKYTVEDLTGKNYIEVKTLLENVYGLVVTIEEKIVEAAEEGGEIPDYDSQEIIGQSVDPGTVMTKEDTIILYIPKEINEYPNFVKDKWSVEEVRTFTNKYNIILTVSYKETNESTEGTILSQSRAAKSEILENSTLTIVVAKAIPVVEENPDEGGENNEEGIGE